MIDYWLNHILYSHGQELFYKFVSNFTNNLVKQLLSMTRDAHFPAGNRETGNQGPGNFPREMGDRENSGKPGKYRPFLEPKTSKFCLF